MKFKDYTEVIDLIKGLQRTPKWIDEARAYHKEMKALLYGEEYKELLLRIEHIESAKKAKARKNYARPIKDVNAKLLEPVSNVYSATGGAKEYNIQSDTDRAAFMRKLSNVRGGKSLEAWLETYWSKDLYNVDPSGVMMLEWDEEIAYPTYKSIDVIQYYKCNGQRVEFIVFSPVQAKDKTYKIWRVVDAEKEYIVKDFGDTYQLESETAHIFGYCPAVINSDRIRLGKEYRLAPIDNIIEAEKEFLRDRSILTIHKFLNGFSIPYRPALLCKECHGSGKRGDEQCPECNGKGFLLNTDVVDEIILPIDTESDTPPAIPTNFAGFISPDLEIWTKYREEQKTMFNEMFETLWGTRETEVKDQTAMGVILNTQPMISRLNIWSDAAQTVEVIFTELLANFYITTKAKNERIAVVSYGRNYIIQPPEFLLETYQKSKEKGDNAVILDAKLNAYITARYKNDPVNLRVELIKRNIEPYIHLSIEMVRDIYGITEAQKKGLFPDFWETLTQKDLLLTEDKLIVKRDEYYNKMITEPNGSQNE